MGEATGSNYMSLFDFQGHRDFKNIGRNVYEYARFRKVKVLPRNITINGSNILVMTYPRELLVEYFELKNAVGEVAKFF